MKENSATDAPKSELTAISLLPELERIFKSLETKTLFEIYDQRDGHTWKLYGDGRAEGFPDGAVVINKVDTAITFPVMSLIRKN